VTSVNDAPAGTDNTVTTLEDTAYTLTAADFGFGDLNDGPANVRSTFMRQSVLVLAALAAASIAPLPRPALAETVQTQLTSYEEVPALSTAAGGTFRAFINDAAGTIRYTLSYSGLESDVKMAHIHFGQLSVSGGISVWLCQTAELVDPTGLAPTCLQSGTVQGTIRAANVTGLAAAQGIEAMQFAEVIAAIRGGVAYVNVHSTKFLGGEIRGQLRED